MKTSVLRTMSQQFHLPAQHVWPCDFGRTSSGFFYLFVLVMFFLCNVDTKAVSTVICARFQTTRIVDGHFNKLVSIHFCAID